MNKNCSQIYSYKNFLKMRESPTIRNDYETSKNMKSNKKSLKVFSPNISNYKFEVKDFKELKELINNLPRKETCSNNSTSILKLSNDNSNINNHQYQQDINCIKHEIKDTDIYFSNFEKCKNQRNEKGMKNAKLLQNIPPLNQTRNLETNLQKSKGSLFKFINLKSVNNNELNNNNKFNLTNKKRSKKSNNSSNSKGRESSISKKDLKKKDQTKLNSIQKIIKLDIEKIKNFPLFQKQIFKTPICYFTSQRNERDSSLNPKMIKSTEFNNERSLQRGNSISAETRASSPSIQSVRLNINKIFKEMKFMHEEYLKNKEEIKTKRDLYYFLRYIGFIEIIMSPTKLNSFLPLKLRDHVINEYKLLDSSYSIINFEPFFPKTEILLYLFSILLAANNSNSLNLLVNSFKSRALIFNKEIIDKYQYQIVKVCRTLMEDFNQLNKTTWPIIQFRKCVKIVKEEISILASKNSQNLNKENKNEYQTSEDIHSSSNESCIIQDSSLSENSKVVETLKIEQNKKYFNENILPISEDKIEVYN